MKARLFSPFLVCLVISCAKQMPGEEGIPAAPEQEGTACVEFSARSQTADDRKSSLDGVTPVWDATDCISVFGVSSTNAEFKCTSADGSNAIFSGTTDPEGPYTAIYPYCEDNVVSGSSATLTIPAVQQLAGGRNMAPGVLASVATASKSSDVLFFKNVVALVKMTVADDDVTSILLSSNGTPLAGRATVSSSTAELQSVSDGSTIVTLLPEGDTFAKGDYYIAVIPGSSEGITVSVRHTADARRGEKTSLKTFTAARNTIIGIGSLAASGLDWAYRIYNRKDFDDYAADDANWSIEEDINVCADIDMESKPWHTLDDRLSVAGTFEGNGHCIYNIKIEEDSMQYVGLFGRYYKNVCNLTLGSKDGETYDGVSSITNSYNVDNTGWTYTSGCIVWLGEGRTVENVKNFSNVTTTADCNHKSRTAGVVTWIESAPGAIVKGCSNYGNITLEAGGGSDDNINCGGVVSGVNTTEVTIEDCHNYGKVTGAHIYLRSAGGVVGQNYSAAAGLVIKDCTNDGEVSIVTSATHKHDAMVGGIIAKPICKAGAVPVKITNCVNNGKIYSNAVYYSGVGGIAGWASGADISGCVNNGSIENNSGSGRYQCVGGIVGICGEGYGNNTVKDCVNKGDVLYQGKSFGMTANSSSGTIMGVNAGGIVGQACDGTDEISGNVNYGNVTGINGYVGTKSYPKAYMFVGGIVGYDYGKIVVFDNNRTMQTATITSTVTDNTSSYTNSYAVAGGVIGYQKNSTMLGGTSTATIKASYVSSKGLLYAGTISAWNKAVIEMCHYGGTVNGAAATEANIVGNGNAPVACAPASASLTDEYDSGLGEVGSEEGNWD